MAAQASQYVWAPGLRTLVQPPALPPRLLASGFHLLSYLLEASRTALSLLALPHFMRCFSEHVRVMLTTSI